MGLDNSTIKMKRDTNGEWVRFTSRPKYPDPEAMSEDEFKLARDAFRLAMKAIEPALAAEKAEMDAAFASLPSPFNDGGYMRGKGWFQTVRQASGLSLYEDLLTPDQCGQIAEGLRVFDLDTDIETQLKPWWVKDGPEAWGKTSIEEMEAEWREQTFPGLIAYFQTCADRGYGITSCY